MAAPVGAAVAAAPESPVEKLEKELLRTRQAAARFYGDSNGENSKRFDESLVALIRVLSLVDPAARLSLAQPALVELLNYAPLLLTASTTNASTRSKLLRLLFNIAHYNIQLRRHFSGQLELCGPVFECLKLSLREQLGPQNMIDILRLLQVLTYERCLALGLWTNELISFLLSELSRDDEMEWMPYSIAILCNLANRSKSVCVRIRKSTSYKQFTKRLVKLLQHDSRVVVVSALVLIGYLEEKLRDMVYCPQNIPQTFQCVFNVLILGDCLMTRHIAADLLKRLVVSDSPTVSSTPVVSSTGKDLMNLKFFPKCIQQTAGVIVQQDPRLEETVKVYDVLLAFCSVPTMRTPTCAAILDTPPTEARLTTPLMAVARTARLSLEEAIDPAVPLKAIRLLNFLLKEAVEANRRLESVIPSDRILSIIDASVKTSVQTGSVQVIPQCQRITEGLRLAEVVFSDDGLRVGLLDLLKAPLCAHLLESQLLANPAVTLVAKPAPHRTDPLPEWSAYGIAIVLQLLRVLAVFKDHSKPHKDQYWKSIKDERLVPLLAFAIAKGKPEMVHDALVLYTHCQQSHAFPSRWLGDLIASCSESAATAAGPTRPPSTDCFATPRAASSAGPGPLANGRSRSCDRGSEMDRVRKRLSSESDDMMNTSGDSRGNGGPDTNGGGRTVGMARQIDELLARMKEGMDLKSLKTSDLLAAYENKIAVHAIRERELERLVAAKEAALAQSERLRIQYAAGGAGGSSDADLARIRTLVAETETLRADRDGLATEVAKEREKSNGLEKKIAEVRAECVILAQDCESERELTAALKRSIDEFKAKMEKMSKAVLQLQEQNANLMAEIEMKKDELYSLNESLKRAQDNSSALSLELDKKKQEMRKLDDNLRRLQEQSTAQGNDQQKKKEEIQKLTESVRRTEEQASLLATEIEGLKEERRTNAKVIDELKKQRDQFKAKLEETRTKADRDLSEIAERKRRLKEEMLKLAGEID